MKLTWGSVDSKQQVVGPKETNWFGGKKEKHSKFSKVLEV